MEEMHCNSKLIHHTEKNCCLGNVIVCFFCNNKLQAGHFGAGNVFLSINTLKILSFNNIEQVWHKNMKLRARESGMFRFYHFTMGLWWAKSAYE